MSLDTSEDSTRFHVSLTVADLGRSLAFYRVLFGREPAKAKPDYAKFELADPPLVLSLIPGVAAPGGCLNHLGLRLPGTEPLVRCQASLETAGIRTQREDGVECCHSRQTKFWVIDPDRNLWEIYVLEAEADEHDPPPPARNDDDPEDPGPAVAPAQRRTWSHHLADGPLTMIPCDENSLHEVNLEGSANLRSEWFESLLRGVQRALRPGGQLRLHGLSADSSLVNPYPRLPGPAEAVQFVPAHCEVAHALTAAGFVSMRFERLSEKAYFATEGIGLREFVLSARKPGHRPGAKLHGAVYLGPLSKVEDDFGNAFPRGQRIALNIHDWLSLKEGPAAAQFLFLSPEAKSAAVSGRPRGSESGKS